MLPGMGTSGLSEKPIRPHKNGYPTSDGKPMAETDDHRDLMQELIETLRIHYASDPQVYVSGNLLLFYEPGNKRKHLSPDVFVVKGVVKAQRPNYLLWEEGKGPDIVIELTSSSTRSEDTKKKKKLYQDVLQVPEYFLFDPLGDYLKPPMQGYRLQEGQYVPIKPVGERLFSEMLGLELERQGKKLRLYDPLYRRILPTPGEIASEAQKEADHARQEASLAKQEASRANAKLAQVEAETERLRRELEELRRAKPGS